ncbi:MAG: hypothetical protein ACRDAW_01335 [Metamycoplasmataceae bacterium]
MDPEIIEEIKKALIEEIKKTLIEALSSLKENTENINQVFGQKHLGNILEAHVVNHFQRSLKTNKYSNEINIKSAEYFKNNRNKNIEKEWSNIKNSNKKKKTDKRIYNFFIDLYCNIKEKNIILEFKNDNQILNKNNIKYLYDLVKLYDFTNYFNLNYGVFVLTHIKDNNDLKNTINNKNYHFKEIAIKTDFESLIDIMNYLNESINNNKDTKDGITLILLTNNNSDKAKKIINTRNVFNRNEKISKKLEKFNLVKQELEWFHKKDNEISFEKLFAFSQKLKEYDFFRNKSSCFGNNVMKAVEINIEKIDIKLKIQNTSIFELLKNKIQNTEISNKEINSAIYDINKLFQKNKRDKDKILKRNFTSIEIKTINKRTKVIIAFLFKQILDEENKDILDKIINPVNNKRVLDDIGFFEEKIKEDKSIQKFLFKISKIIFLVLEINILFKEIFEIFYFINTIDSIDFKNFVDIVENISTNYELRNDKFISFENFCNLIINHK